MAKVFIGVDPHNLSATIEVVDDRETVLATGRFATDRAGYAAMRKHLAAWPEQVWAVEGSNGAGRPLAQRLLAEGEHVVAVRTRGLRVLSYDVALEALPMVADRREELTRHRIQPSTGSDGCSRK